MDNKEAAYPPTIIIRHRRENLKKCSLSGHETRNDFLFFKYPFQNSPTIENAVLLCFDAPLITKQDASLGLLILDGTWRYAQKIQSQIKGTYFPRSLPTEIRTAYPRRQEDCSDQKRGLASIEAIYVAYTLLGRSTMGLLDNYIWKDKFIDLNRSFLVG